MTHNEYYPQNRGTEGLPYDDDLEMELEWLYEDDLYEQSFHEITHFDDPHQTAMRPQWVLFPAVMVMVLLLIVLGRGAANMGRNDATQAVVLGSVETAVVTENSFPIGGASTDFIAPYDEYVITQGLHGYSYGHMAIDLAAGMGAIIKAPITGEITALYTDEYGNPTLLLENERYKVMFLHGDYTAVIGQKIRQGDTIGTEGNHGYTMDSAGNLCYGRPGCGYHTHLNVFDKQINANINPLELIQ